MGTFERGRLKPVYLDAVGFSLGSQRRSIDAAETARDLLSPATVLRESGFEFHHHCATDESVLDLALQASRSALERASVKAGDIDLLCFAHCIPANGNVGSVERCAETGDVKHLMDFAASHVQAQLGFDRAQIVGINQMACTALLGAIRVGASLLCTENMQYALCLTADRFPPGAKYEQSFNLISDSGAACVLSTTQGAFRYLGAHHISNGAMAQADDDETAGFFFNYSYRLIHETLAKFSLRLSDVRWIVAQNTNAKAWQVLASLLKFDLTRVQMPTRGDVGHCISGDNLINLAACQANGTFESGDIILLPMAGYGLNWSCVILEKV